MKRWVIGIGAALTIGMSLCIGGAQAQIAAGGGPVDITADSVEVNNAQRSAVYRGHVEVLQDGNRMRSDQLSIFFSSKGGAAASGPAGDFSDIDHMEAVGNVYFVSPKQTARGDRAVYTVSSDTIVITGNVVIMQGENVMKGEKLTIWVRENRSSMEGVNGRVRGVFYPEKKS